MSRGPRCAASVLEHGSIHESIKLHFCNVVPALCHYDAARASRVVARNGLLRMSKLPSTLRTQGRRLTDISLVAPVSVALYGVLFEREPLEHAQQIAEMLVRNRPPEKIASLVEEIELELEHPTQQVRDIIENVASEAKCRAFLAAVVHRLRAALP